MKTHETKFDIGDQVRVTHRGGPAFATVEQIVIHAGGSIEYSIAYAMADGNRAFGRMVIAERFLKASPQ